MPFSRPALGTLIQDSRDDLVARFPGADSMLRRAVLDVLSRVWGGGLHGLYGFLSWIARQVIPDTAELAGLERHASIWGVERIAAVAASGSATATGEDLSPILAGTVLQRSDGLEYVVLADVAIAASVATLALAATTPGEAGNAVAGVGLSFVSPVAGVASNATVVAITGGSDEELDDKLRQRLLERISTPPQGGAEVDYRLWALASDPEITRVWVRPSWMGPGTVGVTVVYDGRADIIPTGPDIDELQAYLDARRPVTAHVYAFAPTPVALNVTLSITPDTTAVRAAIQAELLDLLAREAEPGGTILLSHIREAVSAAAGETDSTITVPAANVVVASNEIAVLGALTWT